MTDSPSNEQPETTQAGPAKPASFVQAAIREIREIVTTVAVFIPFWLVFMGAIYELRSIPSESMLPALRVGDRVAVRKFVFGYNRNSIPFGIGRLFLKDDPANPDDRWLGRTPDRGDILVFKHPRQDMVMIKRVVGLPGDTVQMVDGRLFLNGAMVEREPLGQTSYIEQGPPKTTYPVTVDAYQEQLPGEKRSHTIYERSDSADLDATPVFTVPAGHLFMMGDNRDNSLDSRDPPGHPERVATEGFAWSFARTNPADTYGMGFVPFDHIIGRADTVLFSFNVCLKKEGIDCPKPQVWKAL